MSETTKTIICPVDLSENSLAVIDLATTLAKQHNAKLKFMHVAPQWLSEDTMMGSDYISREVEESQKKLRQLRPSDASVEFEHQLVNGNAGPEIVRASHSSEFIVMSTHGNSGLIRFLTGSVAQYVLRHAKCPVVLFKNKEVVPRNTLPDQRQPYVTEIMHQVVPLHEHDSMTEVLEELKRAGETAAPVANSVGNCIGILTLTDIERYRKLKQRFDEHDESVLDEVFEKDDFGLRRTDNAEFDQVKRHMTSAVITIKNDKTCEQAFRKFEAHSDIHHLVIVDEQGHPVGIAESEDLLGYEFSSDQ